MSKYSCQVNKKHYSGSYESIPRFVSYYHQQKIIRQFIKKIKEKKEQVKILEIGAGSGFLKLYVQANFSDVEYKIFDIAEDLNPDYVGDIMKIGEIVHENFDIICCFQVLEHVQFNDAVHVIGKLRKITDYLFISLPYVRLHIAMNIKIVLMHPLEIMLSLPFPIKHKFNGEHYWELGTNGHSLKKFRKIVNNKNFEIIDEFSHVINPWHRFFVCQ